MGCNWDKGLWCVNKCCYPESHKQLERLIPEGTILYSIEDLPPPIPETCGFCTEPCNNDWCVTKEKK